MPNKPSYEQIFYYSSLFFAFTFPLSHAAISFFTIWFLVLFLIHKQYKLFWNKIKNIPLIYPLGSLIAFVSISFLWSEDSHMAFDHIKSFGYWLIIPILAVYIKRHWISDIITAFLLGMVASEILAYGMYFELWRINERGAEYPVPFMSHIHYSVYLALTSVILLSRLLSDRYEWRSKIPMLLFFITSTGNLLISTGRTGQLAFFVALGVALILHYRLSLKSVVLFVGINAVLFVGAYQTIGNFQKRIDHAMSDIKKVTEGNFGSSWGIRAGFWIITYDIFKEHPLLGVGAGDFEKAATDVLAKYDHHFSPDVIAFLSSNHFHNQYLMIIVQYGLVGLSLLIWLMIQLFRLKIDNPELKEFSVLSLTVYFVGCIAEPLWILQFPLILFIFIVSVSIAASINQKQI